MLLSISEMFDGTSFTLGACDWTLLATSFCKASFLTHQSEREKAIHGALVIQCRVSVRSGRVHGNSQHAHAFCMVLFFQKGRY